ncbi:pickpocket protein 11-like [Nilaparvata lugens]|uniref:pickpocket protein 11-like n=1 Tax=Nilaparvata lugens TaxID=108931 RepID=UPI00193CB8B8|nr:pickpocket protein 11-like [Nilaparvata lugens]
MLPADQLLKREWFDDLKSTMMPNFSSYQYKYFSQEKVWDAEDGYLSPHTAGKIPWRCNSYLETVTSFVLDINIDDMEEICMVDGPGFLVAIHNPAETPTAYQTIASADKDMRTMLKITPKMVLTSDDLRSWLPEKRGCFYNHERKLRYFKFYTRNNCNSECEMNATLQKCNCLQPFHNRLHTTPLCGGFAMKCYISVLFAVQTLFGDIATEVKYGSLASKWLQKARTRVLRRTKIRETTPHGAQIEDDSSSK